MNKIYPFREERKEAVPSVVHIDGTGRLQAVSKGYSPRFYDLITEFYRLSGVPMVLNTSLNLNGEPIACSPADALRTFYTSGIDVMFIDNFMIDKQ
jgi:carbamoyltransferase